MIMFSATLAVAGVVLGCAGTYLLRAALVSAGRLQPLAYPLVSPWLVAVIALIVVMALGAGRIGSRAVLTASPAQGLVGAVDSSQETRPAVQRRTVASLALIGGGALLLVLSMWLGEEGRRVPGCWWRSVAPPSRPRVCWSALGWSFHHRWRSSAGCWAACRRR